MAGEYDGDAVGTGERDGGVEGGEDGFRDGGEVILHVDDQES